MVLLQDMVGFIEWKTAAIEDIKSLSMYGTICTTTCCKAMACVPIVCFPWFVACNANRRTDVQKQNLTWVAKCPHATRSSLIDFVNVFCNYMDASIYKHRMIAWLQCQLTALGYRGVDILHVLPSDIHFVVNSIIFSTHGPRPVTDNQ